MKSYTTDQMLCKRILLLLLLPLRRLINLGLRERSRRSGKIGLSRINSCIIMYYNCNYYCIEFAVQSSFLRSR